MSSRWWLAGPGAGSGGGHRRPRCDLLIDMSRMDAVVEHSSGDLVARIQAGARMGDVAAVLARAGQEIALDVPAEATVGGVVATGLAGPRRLRYGTPRDLLIGITIVRADGTVARSGGKVVKNVAGYDLGKLFAGSAGTLGADHRCDVPAAPAARRAGVRHRRVRGRWGRVRRGRGGGELAAGRLRRRAQPVRAGRSGSDRRAARGVGRRGGGPRAADGGSDRRGGDLADPAALVARGAVGRPGRRCSGLLLGVGADHGARCHRRGGARPRGGADGPPAGVLYVTLASDGAAGISAETPTKGPGPSGASESPGASDIARFVGALRSALARERGGVAVLATPTGAR